MLHWLQLVKEISAFRVTRLVSKDRLWLVTLVLKMLWFVSTSKVKATSLCWSLSVSLSVQEFPPTRSWAECGPQRAGSRFCDRHCRRRGREGHSSAAKAFRGHDPHFDFCWGLGSLWAHCCSHPLHKRLKRERNGFGWGILARKMKEVMQEG